MASAALVDDEQASSESETDDCINGLLTRGIQNFLHDTKIRRTLQNDIPLELKVAKLIMASTFSSGKESL